MFSAIKINTLGRTFSIAYEGLDVHLIEIKSKNPLKYKILKTTSIVEKTIEPTHFWQNKQFVCLSDGTTVQSTNYPNLTTKKQQIQCLKTMIENKYIANIRKYAA